MAARRCSCVVVLLGILALSAHHASAAPALPPPAPVRLAILPGEGDRAPDEAVIAQLEVALTNEKEITLLERALVRKILAEQKLSASGLNDPATAVKLGKLIPVELFLFIERVPKANPPICRIEAIEAKTGIILAGDLQEEKRIVEEKALCLDLVRQAARKQAIPQGERRCAAILGLRNEEPGQALDGLARTLWMLLSTDLQECPALILDREHLQRLREEKQLTDVEQALKLSAVLLEGGIRHSAENGKVELTLLLQPLAGGEPERLALQFDPAKLEFFRRELVAAIAARLKLKPPSPAASDAEKEGRRFLIQSQMLTVCGEKDAALRAAEAAYALWSDRSTRLALALSCSDHVLQYRQRPSNVGPGYDEARLDAAGEKDRVRSLQFELRMLTLFLEQYEIDLATAEKPSANDWGRLGELRVRSLPGLGIVTRDATGEAAALQLEVAAMQRKLFDVVAAAARRAPEQFGALYEQALESAIFSLQQDGFQHAADKAKGWGQVFDYWRKNRNAQGAVSRDFALFFQTNINNSLQFLRAAQHAETRPHFVAAFSPYTTDADPLVRFTAHYGLLIIDPAAFDSAEGVLKYLRDDIRWADYTMGRETSLGFVAWRAVELMGSKDPKLAVRYADQIMGPWMKDGGDSWRVAGWYDFVHEWARLAAKADGKAEADAVYGRAIAAIRDSLKRWPNNRPGEARHIMQEFEEMRTRLGVTAVAVLSDDPWSQYDIRALGLKLPGAADAVIVRNDRLYCVLCKKPKENERRLTISIHPFPSGGPAERTESLTVPVEDPLYFDECWPAFIGDRLYVGTGGGLALLAGNNSPRLLTEADGLPGTLIGAMAAYGDRLYLGIGRGDKPKHAFALYDPIARASRILFSNTAVESDRRRDLPIRIILADEERKCLWIGADAAGLHRFDPRNETLEPVAKWRFPLGYGYSVHPMAFCPGGLLYASTGSGLTFVDLEDYKQKFLVGAVHAGPNGYRDTPAYGSPGGQVWPAWYDGTALLTGGTEYGSLVPPYPVLHCVGQEAAPNRNLRGLRLFEPTPSGLLAMDSKGEGYLLRKKTPETPPAKGKP